MSHEADLSRLFTNSQLMNGAMVAEKTHRQISDVATRAQEDAIVDMFSACYANDPAELGRRSNPFRDWRLREIYASYRAREIADANDAQLALRGRL